MSGRRRKKPRQGWPASYRLTLLLAPLAFAFLAAIGGWSPVVALNADLLGAVQSAFPFGHYDWLSLVLVVGASQVSLPILALIGLLLLRDGERRKAISIGLILLGVGLEVALKATLGHPPIFLEFLHGPALYPFTEFRPESLVVLSSPFPSGHMLRATFLVLVLASFLEERLTAWVLAVLRVLSWGVLATVALGLFYLGWHWPTDVLGGLALGCFLAAIYRYRSESDRTRAGGNGYKLVRR